MAQSRAKSGSRRKSTRRAPARSGSSFWPWMAALVVIGGGIALHDNFPPARRFIASLSNDRATDQPIRSAAREETRDKAVAPSHPRSPTPSRSAGPIPPRPIGAPDRTQTAAIIPPAPVGKPGLDIARSEPAARGGDRLAGSYEAKFFLCGTAKQDDCVVSADRFVFHGEKIRLVGVEVPDIKKPRCEAERIKASDAKLRVRAFLDSGPFDLVSWQGNDAEVEGHKLRDVSRNGRSLADVLVHEGLAKRPGQGKGGWCG